jgi:hypothetical protein
MSKKRAIDDDTNGDGILLHTKKQKPNNSGQPPPNHNGGQTGVLMPQIIPQSVSPGPSHHPNMRSTSRQPPPVINEPPPDSNPQHQPAIDPSLFSYPAPEEQHHYTNGSYPYPSVDHQEPQYGNFQSLEQLANEVLDMSGRAQEDYIDAQLNAPLPHHQQYPYHTVHIYPTRETAPLRQHHVPKPDGSVDSAVSLPNTEPSEHRERSVDDRLRDALAAENGTSGLLPVQPSVELNGHAHHQPNGAAGPLPVQPSVEVNGDADYEPSASARVGKVDQPQNNGVHDIPLYQPPTAPSQSP